jgi:hypothetical protein
VIQITPQLRILVAVEAIDGRKGIDSLAQLCREKLNFDPFFRLPVYLPQPQRAGDPHPGLCRPGILAGHQALVQGALPLVADGSGSKPKVARA